MSGAGHLHGLIWAQRLQTADKNTSCSRFINSVVLQTNCVLVIMYKDKTILFYDENKTMSATMRLLLKLRRTLSFTSHKIRYLITFCNKNDIELHNIEIQFYCSLLSDLHHTRSSGSNSKCSEYSIM